ncbi:DUF2399 domain-containing protein [Streptomyces sp. NBC_01304]|uniref:DUF2399 domain-containing protein n=1 Tax=Streptomyces sp. NBC_01304 TaxID=2903818 RepID=UPI002E0EBEBD|nr:DUF2399 domain-containing protein [Streptomyces sp. NBC_01304]WSJ90871.1 DUF2399 domain-containing protein [Streptomyces sp. NBC_01304]
MTCSLCADACSGADLAPLLAPELAWLWQAIAAAADRRGDEALTDGPAVTVSIPASPTQRAAAAGLISGQPLASGQRRRIDLGHLTTALTARGPALTPGAVAAHACGRRLAARARARTEHAASTDRLRTQLETTAACLPAHVRELVSPTSAFTRLRSSGWIARILNQPDPAALLAQAFQVAGRLPEPGHRIDRRTLVPGDPHALDGGPLPALVLALTQHSGTVPRLGWERLGVDFDDLIGGLIVTGVTPRGWHVPPGATLTLPPRELTNIAWAPPPKPDAWVFVTENPSVLAAASTQPSEDDRTPTPPRVICTAGTPSSAECAAIGALHHAGWRVAVRADFDQAGLAHMRALLAAAPQAVPWRMSAADYLATAPQGTLDLRLEASDAPWDVHLVPAMKARSAYTYEEDLLPALLADIAAGVPDTGLP